MSWHLTRDTTPAWPSCGDWPRETGAPILWSVTRCHRGQWWHWRRWWWWWYWGCRWMGNWMMAVVKDATMTTLDTEEWGWVRMVTDRSGSEFSAPQLWHVTRDGHAVTLAAANLTWQCGTLGTLSSLPTLVITALALSFPVHRHRGYRRYVTTFLS